LFVLILLGVWVGYEYFSESNQILNTPLKYIAIAFFTILSSLNYLTFLILIIYYMRKIEIRGDRFILSFVGMLLAAFIVRWLVTFFAFSDSWVLGIVILIFFTTNLLPLLYLKFKADDIFDLIKADKTDEDRFEKIFKKYKISNREKEIIKQICSGKTNQQIADELFISLQTVKDHTHRIYTKIGINSRMKLVQVVNV